MTIGVAPEREYLCVPDKVLGLGAHPFTLTL